MGRAGDGVDCDCGVVVKAWLGPFIVVKERKSRGCRHARKWAIVGVSGHAVQIGIPYKVDAETACKALNAGPKVIR